MKREALVATVFVALAATASFTVISAGPRDVAGKTTDLAELTPSVSPNVREDFRKGSNFLSATRACTADFDPPDDSCWVAYAPTHFNPDWIYFPDTDDIRDDLIALRSVGFRGLVTYGCDSTLRYIPGIAREVGFEFVIMGVWCCTNFVDIGNAISESQYVDGYVVGNEGLTDSLQWCPYDTTDLLLAMDSLCRATGLPVTTTERVDAYLPGTPFSDWLWENCDWIFPNVHPFWHCITDPDSAAAWTARMWDSLGTIRDSLAPGKVIIFKEVGLPTDCDSDFWLVCDSESTLITCDGTYLSEAKQAAYYDSLRKTDTRFFYFEAFDGPWKTWHSVEPYWGLFRCDSVFGWNVCGASSPKMVVDMVIDPACAVHDVGTDTIMIADTVYCDSSYTVQASVHNYGNVPEDFDVLCIIDSFGTDVFTDTQSVWTLFPDSSSDVPFVPDWTVPIRDSIDYGVLVFTDLAGDANTGNDSLLDSVFSYCLWVRDVGPTATLSPPDTGFCDSTYDVRAEIYNYGNMTEDFDVEAFIDSGGVNVYGDTQTVTQLAPGEYDTVDFVQWPVPADDSTLYQIRYRTMLAADEDLSNDTLFDTTFIYCSVRDVGPTLVLSPGDSVYCDSTYPIQARVGNFGQQAETFDVNCQVDSSGAVFLDSAKTVSNLAAGDSVDVTFSTGWQVPVVDAMDYGITITTHLVGDAVPTNDVLVDTTTSMCLWFRDVSPISITWPVDTVYCDSSNAVTARVINGGQISEDFSVETLIETSGVAIYAETTDVMALLPSDTTDAVFPAWTVPQLDYFTYDIRVTTLLVDDAVPGNDTLTGTTYGLCPAHDGGVVTIDSPPDSVDVDSTYTPCATVHNYGNRTETFDVICTIDGYEDTAAVADLMPDSSKQVCFQDWSAPGLGQYTMCVTTYVPDDANDANDSLCKVIESVTAVEEVRLLPAVPRRTQVFQNSPNPFSTTMSVEYAIAKEGMVRLSVYDAAGREVKVLVEENTAPGYYRAVWNARDQNGNAVPSGIYFYTLEAGDFKDTKKMILLR